MYVREQQIQHKEGDGAEDEPAETEHKDEADAEAEEAQENEAHVVLGMWRVMIVDF